SESCPPPRDPPHTRPAFARQTGAQPAIRAKDGAGSVAYGRRLGVEPSGPAACAGQPWMVSGNGAVGPRAGCGRTPAGREKPPHIHITRGAVAAPRFPPAIRRIVGIAPSEAAAGFAVLNGQTGNGAW